VQGIVTRTDLLEAIAGDLPDLDAEAELKVVRREDGSLLIDATMPIAEAAEYLGIPDLSRGDFLTLAGFVLSRLDQGVSYGRPEDRQGSRATCFAKEPCNAAIEFTVRKNATSAAAD
jgi:CBS domain containing-hemolysin-like protein